MARPAFVRRRNDIYVGILALSALATAVGCVLLALELNTYDWQTSPGGQKLTVPTLPAEEPAAAPGGA